MEKKEFTYTLSTGAKCCQRILTVRKDQALLRLLFNTDAPGFTPAVGTDLKLADLIKSIIVKDCFEDFLKIILIPVDEPFGPDALDINNEELEAILNDFFSLNKTLRKLFDGLKSIPASKMMTLTSSLFGLNSGKEVPAS